MTTMGVDNLLMFYDFSAFSNFDCTFVIESLQ